MKANNKVRDYRAINLILAVILTGVFVYAAVFPPEGGHPLPSGTKTFFRTSSPSTGLSRSFSAMVRFDVKAARQYNAYGPRLFFFFLLQLFLRITLLLLLARFSRPLHTLYIPDIMLSTILFFVVFWPFIRALFSAM